MRQKYLLVPPMTGWCSVLTCLLHMLTQGMLLTVRMYRLLHRGTNDVSSSLICLPTDTLRFCSFPVSVDGCQFGYIAKLRA
ncbi:hypothetical protein F5879DRAFT_947849 [Lentinula edodes]|nr:hypothetical protein F5879DRAFT_947849 [Lentinula edodes]